MLIGFDGILLKGALSRGFLWYFVRLFGLFSRYLNDSRDVWVMLDGGGEVIGTTNFLKTFCFTGMSGWSCKELGLRGMIWLSQLSKEPVGLCPFIPLDRY